jgi:hypothetical protein
VQRGRRSIGAGPAAVADAADDDDGASEVMKSKSLFLLVLATVVWVSNAALADAVTFYNAQASFDAAVNNATLLDDFSFPPGTGQIVFGVPFA